MTDALVRDHRLEPSRGMLHAGFALLILPWFAPTESVRLSGEHLSAVTAWLADTDTRC